MRKIPRLSPPDCLNDDIQKSKAQKIRFYENLKDAKGNIHPRWNTTCKEGENISQIRRQLLKMSHNTCVYCGIKINDNSMDVDHYLPSSEFPYLAYCWNNLLPACKTCNQNIKSNFLPDSLKNIKIVEKLVSKKFEHDLIYDKELLLNQIAKHDRLIEPTFDDPEEHLQFNPEFYWYEAKTKIGEMTISKFFPHNELEIAEKFEELSHLTKQLILTIDNPQEILKFLNSIITSFGYEYVFLKFYEYWLREKETGRIYRV